jgi:hypothetical protein
MATQIRYGDFAMMGQQTGIQPKIFYPHLNLEQRVPRTHLLRKIQEQIDFNFIYAEVKKTYGDNGNVFIPPPVIWIGLLGNSPLRPAPYLFKESGKDSLLRNNRKINTYHIGRLDLPVSNIENITFQTA